MKQNYIFYGENNGVRVIHFIKECVSPTKTSEYKSMMRLLENYVYERTGYMTAKAWNKESQFIKVNMDINLK